MCDIGRRCHWFPASSLTCDQNLTLITHAHTHMRLSLSSIICYQSNKSDASFQWLDTVGLVTD